MNRNIIGLCGRNDKFFQPADYEIIRVARLSWLKMMSDTDASVFQACRKINPQIQFIVRLYHPSFNTGGHLSWQEFVEFAYPVVNNLLPYTVYFAVHNESNHAGKIEGWGSTDADAHSFGLWFMYVSYYLKQRYPQIKIGFPGLAMPDFIHRDLQWLHHPTIKLAIDWSADWLGCHCYWQTPDEANKNNHLSDNWGLQFKKYHELYPAKDIHILEAGNSNHQNGYALSEDEMSRQLVEWYREIGKWSYVKSANPFIASSPDSYWSGFAWREGDRLKKVVYDVGSI